MATKTFPKKKIYGITSQLRRAVLSVPTNIVEGYGRQSKKELKQFFNVALGSLAEAEYLLNFASGLGYLNGQNIQNWKIYGERLEIYYGNFTEVFNWCTGDWCTDALI